MKICVGMDIDGPIYDWHYCLYRYFCEFRNYLGTQREFWDYFRTLDDETQMYYVTLPHLYLNMEIRPEVLSAVQSIAEVAEIYYITSREPELKPITLKFFEKTDLPFKENLIFAKSKPEYVRLLGIKYFIDDMPHHVSSLQGIAETYLLTVSHNYNQRDGFNTVGSVREFVNIILGDLHDK